MEALDSVVSRLGLSLIFGVLKELAPDSIAIVGSYGNPKKPPDIHSDLDLVLVFENRRIPDVVEQAVSSLIALDGVQCVYLGVHFQFGHVISAYNRIRPLDWIDIGFMDRRFSRDYLIDLPLTPALGDIESSGAKAIPASHLNHLARKLRKALVRDDPVQALSCAARYLGWLDVMYRSTQDAETTGTVAAVSPSAGAGALAYLRATGKMCDLNRLFALVLTDNRAQKTG